MVLPSAMPVPGIATTEQGSDCWLGTPGSPGVARGRARIVTVSDLGRCDGEDVLLARNGTPALLPAVVRARAVVCEKGGVLSHLAIVARELGKPCVIGVPGIVDAVQTGTWIVVDGTAGTVSVESLHERPAPAGVKPPAPPDEMVPLLRYGLYTVTFERTEAAFDVQSAVRVAALASIPSGLGLGPPWNVQVKDGVVSVPEASYRATIDALVSRIEGGALAAGTLRSQSRSLVAWSGWARLRADRAAADPGLLAESLRRYVAVNRLAWSASLAVEPLAMRYRDFLWDRLDGTDEERQRLFLDSLVMPGSSYMLRSALGEESSLWPTPDVDDSELATAVALAELGRRRGKAAQRDLATRLGQHDARRMAGYVSALTDLVQVTEDKNAGRHACGNALFGSHAGRASIAALLQLDDPPPDPVAAVGAVLEALGRDLDAGLGYRHD